MAVVLPIAGVSLLSGTVAVVLPIVNVSILSGTVAVVYLLLVFLFCLAQWLWFYLYIVGVSLLSGTVAVPASFSSMMSPLVASLRLLQ